jgi:DNA-binding transcriptional LysR family regulator
LANRQTVEVANLGIQFAMVRAGVGACIMSALAASHPSARGLTFRLIDGRGLEREIHLLSRRKKVLSPAAAAFIQVVDSVLPIAKLHPGVFISR